MYLTYIFILELWDDMRSAIDENSSNNVWRWEWIINPWWYWNMLSSANKTMWKINTKIGNLKGLLRAVKVWKFKWVRHFHSWVFGAIASMAGHFLGYTPLAIEYVQPFLAISQWTINCKTFWIYSSMSKLFLQFPSEQLTVKTFWIYSSMSKHFLQFPSEQLTVKTFWIYSGTPQTADCLKQPLQVNSHSLWRPFI